MNTELNFINAENIPAELQEEIKQLKIQQEGVLNRLRVLEQIWCIQPEQEELSR